AVPVEDFRGDLIPAGSAEAGAADGIGVRVPDLSARPVLDPSVPFAAHSTEGDVVDVRAGGQTRPGAGFRPSDAELAGYVVLDFGAFDAWYEEDERNVAHPRDPFHRVDVLASSRRVSLELGGQVLAHSTAPYLLFEPPLPVRYYFAADDVRTDLFVPSD